MIVHFMPEPLGKTLCGLDYGEVVYSDRSKVTCHRCRSLLSDETDLSAVQVVTPHPEPTTTKLKPAFGDNDLMPFGKWVNCKMKDVPASYLHWLWTIRPIKGKNGVEVENYIANNIEALKKEYKDGIWS